MVFHNDEKAKINNYHYLGTYLSGLIPLNFSTIISRFQACSSSQHKVQYFPRNMKFIAGTQLAKLLGRALHHFIIHLLSNA